MSGQDGHYKAPWELRHFIPPLSTLRCSLSRKVPREVKIPPAPLYKRAAEDKKYNISVQLDSKGAIIGAVSMHLLSDSIRIETIGGLGQGAGKSCLISAIRQSIKAGKRGAITLTPVGGVVSWYQKMGFIEKADSRYPEIWLSPEAAKKLMD